MQSSSTKIKIFSLTALWICTIASVAGAYFATQVPTNYSMEQFLPKKHPLLKWDHESKKVFQISKTSPHVLILSYDSGGGSRWYQKTNLERLGKLSDEIKGAKGVNSVISLGNISAAFEKKGELLVGNLSELEKHGYPVKSTLTNPLYTPNLMSADGLHSSVFVMAEETLSQDGHKALMKKMRSLARKHAPGAKIQIGGPSAIRTQFIDLLSREILIFLLLTLVCSVIVLKVMFHGLHVIWQALFVLLIANTLALGAMGLLQLSFTVLSSTVPIIVTVSALGVFTHLLVRMSEAAGRPWEERMTFLKSLIREITLSVTLTGLSTAIGFACLIPANVQVISDYGLAVSLGVIVSCVSSLVMVPSLYAWVNWPQPRALLNEPKRFAYFIARHYRWLTPGIGVFTVALAIVGMNLSWTAKLFDDLPAGHAARRSTDLISKKLGGVASVDFAIGGDKLKDPWKQPANIAKLQAVAAELRARKDVGSVLALSDFLATDEKKTLPRSRAAIAELQFLYGMSGESPLKQFLSSNEKWTRVSLRLPDLPSDKNQAVIGAIKSKLEAKFPGMQVKTSGFAAMVPAMNNDLSKKLMWGFFEAMFGIVLLLTVAFRSLRWALIGVLPNMLPPAMLLAYLAYFDVPIKPGIAIIFSISLGLVFDNTVYILGRLRHLLKENPKTTMLPIYTLMKKETMPCLVSSMCLFAGFSIFLFSMFPMNRMFGFLTLVAILAGLLGDLVWLPAMMKRFPWLLLDGPKGAKLKAPFRLQETAMKLSPYILLAMLGMIALHNTYADGATKTDVKQILQTIEKNGAPANERVQIKMTIKDADGSKKERTLSILRKTKGETRALVRLQSPSDLKGLTLLTVASKEKEDQWLYLPSDKKSRRILGSNKKR